MLLQAHADLLDLISGLWSYWEIEEEFRFLNDK